MSGGEVPARLGITVIIPTYRPSPQLRQRVQRLLAADQHVVVVDDGSGPAADRLLAQLGDDGAEVLRLDRNSGIAAALNRGVEASRVRSSRFVLTLDQDSELPPGYPHAAAAVLGELRERGERVLAVGPGRFITGSGAGADLLAWGAEADQRVLETIQSGLLFDAAALEAIGPFDESFFMDCVDTEVVLRGARHGWSTHRSARLTLLHQLGETHAARLPMGRAVHFSYHGPLRRYYMTRNRAVVWWRFGRVFPRAVAGQVLAQARSLLLCVAYGPSPVRQLLAVAFGGLHAVSGRRGRIPSRLARLLGA